MILVTGGGGFLGRVVCRELRQAALPCLGADLRGADCACDVTDREAVFRLFETQAICAVIHLAALLPSASRADPSLATRVNILGTVNVIDAAARHGVQRFVFGSSMSVFGNQGDGTPLPEDQPVGPTDVYGAAKLYSEIYGAAVGRARGLCFAALRMVSVVGPGARRTASPWRAEIFEKLAIRPEVPAPVYHTPAENWRVEDLKRAIESADANVTVEIDCAGRHAAPPAADGARFVRDFAWSAPGLAFRLAEAARGPMPAWRAHAC